MQMMNDAVKRGVDCLVDYDTMPEQRLDELAWETNFLYDYNSDVETKRRLLKNVFDIYRRLGTPLAMENALQAIFPGSSLQEWFEYGGEPYHFRIEIEMPESGATPEQQARALRNVLFYKNARSVLDKINYFDQCDDAVMHVGAAMTGMTLVDSCQG